MRTVTTTELTNMLASRMGHYLKVEIQSGAGAWVDFSTLGSIDWVDGVSINAEAIDAPVGTAQIQLRRSAQGTRLAPLYGASALNTPDPAIDIGRAVRISLCVMAAGVSPTGADYRVLFLGRVDSVAWEQDPIVVDCSDEGAWLMDTQIESEKDYVSLQLTATDFTSITTGANSIVLAAGDPRLLKGGYKVGDTIALVGMPDNANNKTVTVASLSATTIGTVESLTVNAVASTTPVLTRQSTAIEYVMQQLLDDNTVSAGLGTITLYTPTSPGWQVRAFRQQRTKLLEALRSLALQIGWEVRYRFDSSHVHRLTLFQPPRINYLTVDATATGYHRSTGSWVDEGYVVGQVVWGVGFTNSTNNGAHTLTAVTATDLTCTGTTVEAAASRALIPIAATIGPTHYDDVTRLNLSLADIRNVVSGKYVTEAGNLGTRSASDAASITKVKRRFMEISEDATSNINSPDEMDRLVEAAVNDLAEPKAEQEVLMYLFWPVQFGDTLRFTANGEHYDTDQALAVVSVNHTLSGGQGKTTILTRGRVAGSYSDWLRREVISPAASALLPAPTITLEAENTAEGGAGEGMVRLLIKFDQRTDHILVYASESASSGQSAPEQSANRLAGIVQRHEGTLASSDTWETEFDISTTPSYYRKVVAVPVGPTGVRGNPVVLEAQAVDTGTGPTGNVTGFGVTMSETAGVAKATLLWANADANASVRVFRNGVMLKRCTPGTTGLVDDNLAVGSSYTYAAQAIRNGQTAGVGGGDTSTAPPSTPTLSDLINFYAYGGSYNAEGEGLVSVSVSNPDPLAYTELQIAPDVAGVPGSWDSGPSLLPGQSSLVLNHAELGLTEGALYWFRGRAVRSGYTSSGWSAEVSTTFGLAS